MGPWPAVLAHSGLKAEPSPIYMYQEHDLEGSVLRMLGELGMSGKEGTRHIGLLLTGERWVGVGFREHRYPG